MSQIGQTNIESGEVVVGVVVSFVVGVVVGVDVVLGVVLCVVVVMIGFAMLAFGVVIIGFGKIVFGVVFVTFNLVGIGGVVFDFFGFDGLEVVAVVILDFLGIGVIVAFIICGCGELIDAADVNDVIDAAVVITGPKFIVVTDVKIGDCNIEVNMGDFTAEEGGLFKRITLVL